VQWANCVKCHGPHLHDAANPQHTCCRPCWEPGATFAVCSGCWALHHQLKLINLQAMPRPQRGSSLECEQRDCRQCVYGSPIHSTLVLLAGTTACCYDSCLLCQMEGHIQLRC
jgi:hypothetical protein